MRTSLRRSQQLLQVTSLPTRRNLTPSQSLQLPASTLICQVCHTSLLYPNHKSKPQSQSQKRLNSSSSPPTSKRKFESTTPSALPISKTHYDLFPLTLSQGPPPSGPFHIDLRALRKEFLQLQSKSHPDLFPPHLKIRAEGTSSSINTAYKTLQSPLSRAQYLLSLQGIETAEDETAKVEDPELLMEVMDAREAVENAEEEHELDHIKKENEERIRITEERLGERFEQGDWDGARELAIRLRYWVNVRESIAGWEKGQGGGVNHH